MLTKRTLKLNDYDTASNGWTLASLEFPEPEPETNFVPVPGRVKGPLDLSRALTGEPVYGSRDFLATLEISTGDRSSREDKIAELINLIHGRQTKVVIPDRPDHYAVGIMRATKLYNDHAHGSVEIAGVCEPWLYATEETVFEPEISENGEFYETLIINGAMSVTPVVKVTGGSMTLIYNTSSATITGTLDPSELIFPWFYLTPGEHVIEGYGTGRMTITYREAVIR